VKLHISSTLILQTVGLVLLGSGTVLQAVYTNYLNYLGDEVG
jgi:hypothetical protein